MYKNILTLSKAKTLKVKNSVTEPPPIDINEVKFILCVLKVFFFKNLSLGYINLYFFMDIFIFNLIVCFRLENNIFLAIDEKI